MLLALQVLVFGFGLWLGLYLLTRDFARSTVRFAAFGLITYACGIGLDALASVVTAESITRLRWSMFYLPGLFWFSSMIDLLPESLSQRIRITRIFRSGWAVGVIGLLAAFADIASPVLSAVVTAVVVLGLAVGLSLAVHAYRFSSAPKPPQGMMIVATAFFGLSLGLLALPIEGMPREIILLAIGIDFGLLGAAAAMLNAFDSGERLALDFVRSLVYALFAAVLFGSQVAVAIAISGLSPALLALLLLIVASAVALQTLSDPLQTALDRVVLPRPQQEERANLRAAASAAARVNNALEIDLLDDAEFARLTRRALSAFGDLNRLAASPLTRLPMITERLKERGAADNTLERAAELKALLSESIQRLKPRGSDSFGTADEWRHYNALYFPYVVGLKPYSRSHVDFDAALDSNAKAALEWLQVNVPERTLYNWQNAAARLIAQHLREQMAAENLNWQ